MTDDASLRPFDAAQDERDRCIAVEDMIDSVAAMMRVARALLQNRRQVDLGGLEHDVGRLCAAALDLPFEQGQKIRPRMASLLSELDALSAALAATDKTNA
jgi:hypothetical protein